MIKVNRSGKERMVNNLFPKPLRIQADFQSAKGSRPAGCLWPLEKIRKIEKRCPILLGAVTGDLPFVDPGDEENMPLQCPETV